MLVKLIKTPGGDTSTLAGHAGEHASANQQPVEAMGFEQIATNH